LNDAVVNQAATGKKIRHRRTWYKRRLRMQRTLLGVFFSGVVAAATWQNIANLLHPSPIPDLHTRASSIPEPPTVGNVTVPSAGNGLTPARYLTRLPGVYPYSVIPGGVRNAAELREATMRDPAVGRHYSQFDFDNARLIRVVQAREVYLSYRIRDTVFWTRKKVHLMPGELLLTDGKITARTKCGNQVSDTAKPEVSEEEPSEDVLNQPVAIDGAPPFPAHPMTAANLPIGSPNPPAFLGGGWIFPYITSAGGGTGCPAGETFQAERCRHKPHHKPPVSPEPSTIFLLSTGVALIAWQYRRSIDAKV
jgi:hypothetical protein